MEMGCQSCLNQTKTHVNSTGSLSAAVAGNRGRSNRRAPCTLNQIARLSITELDLTISPCAWKIYRCSTLADYGKVIISAVFNFYPMLNAKSSHCLILFLWIVLLFQPAPSSTGIVLTDDTQVLVGKNQDFFDPNTRYELVTGDEVKYDWFFTSGSDGYPVNALNTAGLSMDHFDAPRKPVTKSAHKPVYDGNIFAEIMSQAATVTEALAILSRYDLSMLDNGQVLLADRSGASAVVEGDTVVHKSGDYLICTNFYQSEYLEAHYPGKPFNTARQLIGANAAVTVENLRTILQATQQEITQYSTIFDLTNGMIYLYHFRDYDNVIQLVLAEEVAGETSSRAIPELFPEKAEFRRLYFYRLAPQHNLAILILLVVLGLIYLEALIAWPAGWLIRRQDASDYGRAVVDPGPGILAGVARITSGTAALLALIIILASIKIPWIYTHGLPSPSPDSSLLKLLLCRLPTAVGALLVPVLIFTALAWLRRFWSPAHRWHFTLVTLALTINTIFYFYWELIPA